MIDNHTLGDEKMKKVLSVLLCIAFFVVLAIILINAKDETLNPEILPLLTKESKPTNNNAYYMLLGFPAPAKQDPEHYGRQQVDAYEAGEEIQTMNGPWVQDGNNILCKGPETDCFQSYIAKKQEVSRVISDNRAWLQRYRELIRYTDYQRIVKPSLTGPMIQVAALRDSHRLLQAQIVLDPVIMRDLLSQDIAFWRMILGKETDLVTKMLAVSMTKSSYSLLQYILTKHPELQPAFVDELTPLSEAEKSAVNFLWDEFVSLANHLLKTGYYPGQNMSGVFDKIVYSRAGMYFYKKNATVNQVYRIHRRVLAAIPQGIPAIEQVYVEETEGMLKRWNMLYNPHGKVLISIALANPATAECLQRIDSLDQQITKIAAQMR